METRKDIQWEIHDLLARRWSPRAFENRAVPDDMLMKCFEAARWAPSCYNDQPWRFIYAHRENEKAFQLIVDSLVDKNRLWAAKAPVLMIGVAKTHFRHNDTINAHARYDLGQALAAFSFQATSLGLHVHQMAGFSAEKAAANLDIPEGYEAVTAVAVGYAGDAEQLDEKLRAMELSPRTRILLEELVHQNSW